MELKIDRLIAEASELPWSTGESYDANKQQECVELKSNGTPYWLAYMQTHQFS